MNSIPSNCIDCGWCEQACPNQAIFRAEDLPTNGPDTPVWTRPGTAILPQPESR
jgi:formate hydrogenlyase subunit 6/NADH:ubiquinone oxidoreductase subunit I